MITNYLKFLYNSKNQHGVHSPFVFNLVTKCFYNKANFAEYSELKSLQKPSLKTVKLLFRIVNYFKPNDVLTIGKPNSSLILALLLGKQSAEHTSVETKGDLNQLLTEKPTFDLIFFETNNNQMPILEVFEFLLPTAKNNSVWIFNDIYSNSEIQNSWQTIKNHPKVTVTIDTFAIGLVFFRTEQQKQHFTIRV